jgi:recombination associated protein RdgC
MFFRNVFFYTLPEISSLSTENLQAALESNQLVPVGALAMQSRGFVPPLGEHGAYLQQLEHHVWLCMGGEDRILPTAVVHREWQLKIAKLEEAKGHPLGKRARSQLKQETMDDLMPRAFVKTSRLNALINRKHGFIAIDAASAKAAEALVSKIREALGSFPALPLQSAQAPRSILTSFLLQQALPENWHLGEECELQDPAEKGAVVKCLRHDLASEEVLAHLATGKQVSRLGLLLDANISFVLGDDLIVRKFKLLAGAVDALENTNTESLEDELMARFALFSAELELFFVAFSKALQLQAASEQAKAA